MGRRILLDTHALLFALYEPERLSKSAVALIADGDNQLYVSSASAWEIATKHRLGKLDFPYLDVRALLLQYGEHLKDLGALDLPVTSPHAILAGSFEAAHKDPFDRILAAQARLESLGIISKDRALDAFGVRRLW